MADVLTAGPDDEPGRILSQLTRLPGPDVNLVVHRPHPALRDPVALALLHRQARNRGLRLTLVTSHGALRVLARAAGLPVQWDLDSWWALEPLIPVTCLLGLGLILAALFLPQATVVVTPASVPVRIESVVRADPDLPSVDVTSRHVPARSVEVTLQREARVPAEPGTPVPDQPARGMVTFVNQSDSPGTIPSGSIVSAEGDPPVRFRTLQMARLPGQAGSVVQVRIQALEPGSRGNVPAYAITRLSSDLALPVAVMNDRPTEGGTVRETMVVTEAARERARKELLARTRDEALVQLEGQIRRGEVLPADAVRVEIIDEAVTGDTGPSQGAVSVRITVRARGIAIPLEPMRELAVGMLRARAPAEYDLQSDDVTVHITNVVGLHDEGVAIAVVADGVARARLKGTDIENAVRGQPIKAVDALLSSRFPLSTPPKIEATRAWLGRMPWLPLRIDVVVDESGG